jgi:hypothetical protein
MWRFTKYLGTPEMRETLSAQGISPTRAILNDGSVSITDDETGEHIATVSCLTRFKRGTGHEVECARRDANALLIAAAPELQRALEEMLRLFPAAPMPLVDGTEIVQEHPVIATAKKALAQSKL